MKIRVYLTGVFLAICVFAEALAFVGNNCDFPDNWQVMKTTEDGADKALLDLDTATINIGKPFSFNVALCSDNEIKANRVTANAIMPAHQHGMSYTPTVSYVEATNSFEVTDFLFHMPGVWEITIASYAGEIVTHYTKNFLIK